MPKTQKNKTEIISMKLTPEQLERLLDYDPMPKIDRDVKPSPTRALTCVLAQACLSKKKAIKKKLPKVKKTK
jgi:hypothetical protein